MTQDQLDSKQNDTSISLPLYEGRSNKNTTSVEPGAKKNSIFDIDKEHNQKESKKRSISQKQIENYFSSRLSKRKVMAKFENTKMAFGYARKKDNEKPYWWMKI